MHTSAQELSFRERGLSLDITVDGNLETPCAALSDGPSEPIATYKSNIPSGRTQHTRVAG